jgi:hypothetical protein
VINNKYPVLHHTHPEDTSIPAISLSSQKNSTTLPALGYHEVVIEGDKHNATLSDTGSKLIFLSHVYLPVQGAYRLLKCYQERGRFISETDKRVHKLIYFKNNGKNAGPLFFEVVPIPPPSFHPFTHPIPPSSYLLLFRSESSTSPRTNCRLPAFAQQATT